jgi:hypothetical protein
MQTVGFAESRNEFCRSFTRDCQGFKPNTRLEEKNEIPPPQVS